jgi:hypothetical protein
MAIEPRRVIQLDEGEPNHMNYRKIAALALGILLLFSAGCSQNNSNTAEPTTNADDSKTIIEYNGQIITKGDVTRDMNQYLSANGSSVDALKNAGDETWNGFKESYINKVAIDLITLDKAKELGLDQLGDEEEVSLEGTYNTTMAYVDSLISSSVKEAVEKDPKLDYDTEYQKQLKNVLSAMGYDPDTFKEDLKKQYIISKVNDYYIKDIAVTDDDVKSYYDTNVEIQKGNIELSPQNIEMQSQLGGFVLYYPAGYMRVRYIQIRFDDDTYSNAYNAYYKDDKTEYNQIMEQALPTIQPKIDEVVAKMNSGVDFATLIDDYNADSTMSTEPARTEGEVFGPYSSNEPTPGFLDALTKLTKAGDYTLFNTFSGCYIIRCDKILEGAVPFEDIKDDMRSSLLSDKQSTEWSKVTQGWLDDAKNAGTLKLYPEQY